MTFFDGDRHGSAGCSLALTPSPPGILYDPNMVEEQNEQRKPLPKKIQEHASPRPSGFVVQILENRCALPRD